MNQLKHETSPYLLQHKNNPVNWYAWNNEALSIAKNENKLILVSVGYAACHWCHVMEHESFEDNEVAAIMNQYFVAIKVDREERPDIDQIYMNAAQITSGQGGWPLNVVCLPDGKPIYGATYFPKENWMQFLLHFQNLFVNEYDKVFNQADRISKGLQSIDIIELNPEKVSFTKAHLYEIWNNWQPKLDMEFGGRSGAPKFMMPNNLEFLLRYAYQTNDKECNAYIKTTLKKWHLVACMTYWVVALQDTA
ncbi:MAG: thioredoxin domain-containing protein [Sphingobacteriales bacterium]|nr:MAG: thioredoxin domain-containing protein [Sphingobacteriales bacterium]